MAIEVINNTAKSDLDGLQSFLDGWDKKYLEEVSKIPLFDQNLTKNWSEKQKSDFIKIFYHVRGHFHDFLWYMGNHAPDKKSKEIILKNMLEEFGEDKKSHEQLYLSFAKSMNVDLCQEIASDENYLSFLRDFNKGHLEWLSKHDWESDFCAFSAYERLDNIDYSNLLNLIKSFKTNSDLLFFNVHIQVKHFDATWDLIVTTYQNNQNKLKNAYNFIAEHQVNMWKKLSSAMFEYI